LDKSRFEILVALPSDRGFLPEELAKIPQVKVCIIPSDPVLMGARRFRAFRTVLKQPQVILAFFDVVKRHVQLIRKEHIDLILTNSIKSDYYGSLAAAIARRPVLWYLHDYVDNHYFPGWARLGLVFFANFFAKKILCNSNATCMAIERLGGDRKKLVTVYPPSIDRVETILRPDIRRELDLSPKTRLVTMVGRITAPKGQLEFVRAAEMVIQSKNNVVFLLVGESVFGAYDDNYARQVEDAIQQLPQPQRVYLLGARQDSLGIIAESDVIVFHSLWPEGFGLAVAEAMELGRPVVSTRVGGTVELIEDGVTGLSVEPADIVGMSRAICELLDDPEKANILAKAGQKHTKQILSLNNIQKLQSVLEDLICMH
jgi:glycosyltransferase involved in cell wall biosynthesis